MTLKPEDQDDDATGELAPAWAAALDHRLSFMAISSIIVQPTKATMAAMSRRKMPTIQIASIQQQEHDPQPDQDLRRTLS
jgi:hypothetical protein